MWDIVQIYLPLADILLAIHLRDINLEGELLMLSYAVIFMIIALAAGLFGFSGLAAGAASIAQILFFVFLLLFVISLIMGWGRRSLL